MLEMTSSGAPIEDQARGQNLQAFILSIHDINEFLEYINPRKLRRDPTDI